MHSSMLAVSLLRLQLTDLLSVFSHFPLCFPTGTYIEEAILVHVAKHMYDVTRAEGQLRLGRRKADGQ